MDQNNSGKCNMSSAHGWLILAFVPLAVILVSFVLGGWSWGLMDDFGMLKQPGNWWERFTGFCQAWMASGYIRPTLALHSAVFYKVFASSQAAFYIFRWAECVLALGVWAFLAFRVTRSHFAAPLFVFAVLSFCQIYDAFFYLSTHEILGVLFFGFALLFFLNAFEQRLDNGGTIRWGAMAAGIFFLLLTVGSKEPFLATMGAVGASSIIVSLLDRKKGVLVFGVACLLVAAAYAVFLNNFFSRSEYTSVYVVTNFSAIGQNVLLWAQKDLLYHAPWILLAVVLMVFQKGAVSRPWTRARLWVFLTGALAYAGYLLVLLPWAVWGYYVLPFGFFFAFVLAVLLAERVEALPLPSFAVLAAGSFVFVLVVSATVLKFHSTYQYDTANLMKWMATNALFEHELESGAVVRGNAIEPCNAIVSQVNALYGKGYKDFIFTPTVGAILGDAKTRYYLWGRNWGDQDLSRLGIMWTPMFVSEHWVLFRRMI